MYFFAVHCQKVLEVRGSAVLNTCQCNDSNSPKGDGVHVTFYKRSSNINQTN